MSISSTGWFVYFMYVENSWFVSVFSLFYIYLELFWIYLTMDELYFGNSDVSLVDGEYKSRYTDILHTDSL